MHSLWSPNNAGSRRQPLSPARQFKALLTPANLLLLCQIVKPQVSSDRLTTQEAAELLGVHRLTVGQHRTKYWVQGVHYFPQAKEYLYNRELLNDWQQNRSSPETHQWAIDLWLSRQPSNQPERRKAS